MIDTLQIHLDRIDAVVSEYNARAAEDKDGCATDGLTSLERKAHAARERYHDAKAKLYSVCRDADRLSSKMIREAEALVWSAEAAMREACAAIDAADSVEKEAHYWLERVCAGQRLEYARREGFAPSRIKAYKREYEDACAAYDDYMGDDDY